ncbi:MAG: RNA polymerase sigma factor [Eubacteriales bacterium]
MQSTDKDLIERSKSGDLYAFEVLVRRYEGKVYNIAYRFIGNQADASDLAQEAFLRIYQALPSFRGDSSFMTWLYRIIVNVCRDEIRRQQRYHIVSLDGSRNEENSPVIQVASQEQSPEEIFEQKEFSGIVQECLNELSEEHRLILIMREIQEMSYEEMADALECSLGTVKSRLNRARQSFKEKYLARVEHFSREKRLAR